VIGNRLANIGIYKKNDYNELSSQTELFLNNSLSNDKKKMCFFFF
jgi:hypothetical protein